MTSVAWEGFVTRRRSHSLVRMAVAAALLAACQAGPAVSPSPAATPSPTVAPTATIGPAATPSPGASTVACPSELPTALASVTQLADRSCYGTTELAIEGWLAEQQVSVDHGEAAPGWVMPISALFPDRPTVREWTLDYLLAGPLGGLDVVTPPDTGIDLSGLGRWVTLRGHFNDPAALACTPTLVDSYPDEFAGPDCDRLFVVTGLQGLGRAEPSCPGGSPLSLATFLAADAGCFIGREVRITGWEDVGEGFGGASSAYPITLDPSMRSAQAQLVSERWESDLDHNPIFPWLIEGSGVRFDQSDQRVIVTGRLGHEAANGCRPGPFPSWTWTPPVSWAQHRCMRLFVIDEVQLLG